MKMFKRTCFYLMLAVLTGVGFSSLVNAAMAQQDFLVAQQKDKLPEAIQAALAQGVSVESVVEQAVVVDGINPRLVLTTLCQKGASSRDITQAASKKGISAMIIAAAAEECQTEEPDTQAYTAARQRTRNVVPAVVRQRTGPAEPYVSPSTFQ